MLLQAAGFVQRCSAAPSSGCWQGTGVECSWRLGSSSDGEEGEALLLLLFASALSQHVQQQSQWAGLDNMILLC